MPRLVAVLTLALTVAACASTASTGTAPAPAAAPRTARFDYAPTACAAPASTKLTLAIIAPTWQQQTGSDAAKTGAALSTISGTGVTEMRARFTAALRDDFIELVSCRGLTTRGPFANFDAMVFPDRDGSNLLLEPVIESTMGLVEATKIPRCKGFLGKAACNLDYVAGSAPTSYTVNGTVQLGGRITLTLREPLSNTRMWTKSIEMPSDRVSFTGETVYSGTSGATPDVWADRGVQKVLVPALEAAYAAVLRASDGHLNPRELQLVAGQAADVRRKASISIPR